MANMDKPVIYLSYHSEKGSGLLIILKCIVPIRDQFYRVEKLIQLTTTFNTKQF